MNLWLVLWTRQDAGYRIWTQISRAHSPMVKAADCRSAGPWFNSGWTTLFTFVTWYEKLTNDDFLMINIMSPIKRQSGRLQESKLTKKGKKFKKKRFLNKRGKKKRNAFTTPTTHTHPTPTPTPEPDNKRNQLTWQRSWMRRRLCGRSVVSVSVWKTTLP